MKQKERTVRIFGSHIVDAAEEGSTHSTVTELGRCK